MLLSLVVCLYVMCSQVGSAVFTHKDHLKSNFEHTFHKKCDKYPFVKRWVDRLEYTDDRYITFVYQAPGFRNGGLGDRFGGLISAVAIAARFNRTLLIKAENDVGKLFRPYHPTDIKSPTPKYNWNNWTSWSNYNSKYEGNDDTEYDIYDCINNVGSKNRHCSVNDVFDVPQQHILYRSNRAYLCFYENNPQWIGGEQMLALGVNKSVDLFEVAGCMMRLALWPTDFLWEEVSSIYQKFEDSEFKPKQRRRNLRKLDTDSSAAGPVVVPEGVSEPHANAEAFYQIGMHFRCGDKSFLGRAGDQCVYDPVARPNEPGMLPGNPVGIAQCARDILRNLSLSLLHHHTSVDTDELTVAHNNKEREQHHDSKVTPLRRRHLLTNDSNSSASGAVSGVTKKFELAFITSDSTASSAQMKAVLGHPHTLISPQGCHIEMDASLACHLFTVSYWLVLSLSDVLVTQTLGYDHTSGPTSSFSRYAGIYGLKDDVFRDGRHCDEITSNHAMSRMQQSNWFC